MAGHLDGQRRGFLDKENLAIKRHLTVALANRLERAGVFGEVGQCLKHSWIRTQVDCMVQAVVLLEDSTIPYTGVHPVDQ